MNNRLFVLLIATLMGAGTLKAQSQIEGTCGEDTKWIFDGYTLTITNVEKMGNAVAMDDYGVNYKKAPWCKKNLNVRKVVIEYGVTTIGSCAFAGCTNLEEVVFNSSVLTSIGWGAFLNCTHLRNISFPIGLKDIGTIAFANCQALNSVKIPGHCRVGAQAFASCRNLQSLECAPTADLGHLVFVKEEIVNGKKAHAPYTGEIRQLPPYINLNNCQEYGLDKAAVEKVVQKGKIEENYDLVTSKIDTDIPVATKARNDLYALIIGNQNYRFVSDVPYAIHDARVFSEYCKKTLGIPVNNIHITEDATKHMILEEELYDWVSTIPNRDTKKLIVYYAGHGVPDIKNKNKAYILPTDVRGTHPQYGISLDDFYADLGEMGFAQTTVFLDACFSGINRNNEGVTEGLRGVEIEAEEGTLSGGSLVVFSAAKGNETAQGFPDQGHGLFTYYLLKEIQTSGGDVDFGRMSENIQSNVSEKAKELKLRKKQTPTTTPSERISESWRNLKF